jgi:predicted Zn-dependent protease
VIHAKPLPLAVLFIGAIFYGCQSSTIQPLDPPSVQQGYQPALDSDEAGLWLVMDQAEKDLKTSGKLITDTKANDYLRDVICRLAEDICPDVRVYLVRVPYFNATMAPNGVMQVWSGLLLRAENEAQLAYILGHEIAHYRYQHSLQIFRQAKNTANILAPFQVLTAAGGVWYVGSFAQLGAIGTLMKFSRDHEREADDGGFRTVVAAGYNPHEAARIWEGLEEEKEALDESAPSLFLSTHPSPGERVETLRQRAMDTTEPDTGWYTGSESYNAIVDPLRFELMRDELRLRQFAATQILLDRAKEAGRPAAEISFFQAELYNARSEKGDTLKAEQSYSESVRHADAPPDAYRELAMIYMKSDRGQQAVPLFETYLAKRPDAFDRSMVKAYIQRIGSGEN